MDSGSDVVSAYDNDPRVRQLPDGAWMVFNSRGIEYIVAQLRDTGSMRLTPDLFGAFDAKGYPVPVRDGPFDDVVWALIGDPQ